MPLEMTRNRLKNLATYEGEIAIETKHQNEIEIVIRIPFGDHLESVKAARVAYNELYDTEEEA
jgi:hypothetical protein